MAKAFLDLLSWLPTIRYSPLCRFLVPARCRTRTGVWCESDTASGSELLIGLHGSDRSRESGAAAAPRNVSGFPGAVLFGLAGVKLLKHRTADSRIRRDDALQFRQAWRAIRLDDGVNIPVRRRKECPNCGRWPSSEPSRGSDHE